MEEVGELHVDGSHGACVLHDPVFVHIWGIVVAGGARRAQRRERGERHVKQGTCNLCIYCVPDKIS